MQIGQQAQPFTTPLPVQINSNNPVGDAFGRLRTSSPTTVFDVQSEYDGQPLFVERVFTGGGTGTHLPNEGCTSISVGTTSGDKVVGQTKEYLRYVPGKSMLIIASRVFGIPKTNTRQRLGLFDERNGLFFENNGTNFGVVRRTYATGTAVDNRVAQSDFNLDKLDGTGDSGIVLDLSKVNIFVIDLQWLGSGRVRFGFDMNGVIIYCHEINNANILDTTYMGTANLPVRNELENTGTSASSTSMKIVCTSVMVEDGSEQQTGLLFSVSNGSTPISVTTRRNILTVRPKATYNSLVNRAKIENFEFEILTDKNIFYEIVYNGTLGGTPSWTSSNANSTVEYDVAGTTVTNGIVIHSGYAGASKNAGSIGGSELLSKLPFVLDVAGTNPTNLSIVITSLDATATCYASFSWKEIR